MTRYGDRNGSPLEVGRLTDRRVVLFNTKHAQSIIICILLYNATINIRIILQIIYTKILLVFYE